MKAQESVLAKYTSKPAINKYSQGFKRSYKTPCEDNLIGEQMRIDQKVFEERVMKDQMENEKYNYQPDINETSRKIGEQSMRVEGRDGADNIHQILYLNAAVR